MKKISLFVLSLCTTVVLFAQVERPARTAMASKTYFGVKAGANLANFRTENYNPEPDVNMKTSANGGFFANIPLSEKLAFQPELLYNGMGSKIKFSGISSEQDLSYISLPLMFQIKTPGGFFVELGPQPSILIRANSVVNGVQTDNKGSFDSFDLGLGGGIGYTSRVGLGANARYNLGLTNTLEDGGGNNSPNDGPELKNSVIQIGLFYLFGASK